MIVVVVHVVDIEPFGGFLQGVSWYWSDSATCTSVKAMSDVGVPDRGTVE